MKITVTDASGTVVREIQGSKEVGVNRANWDLRHEPPVQPDADTPSFFGPPRGPFVPPATYTVKVALGSASASQTVRVEEDPRIEVTEAGRKEWYEASRGAARLWTQADAASKSTESLKKQLTDLTDSLKKRTPAAPETATSAVKALLDKVEAVAKRLRRQDPMGFAGAPLATEPDPLLNRARGLSLALAAMTAPPTTQQRELLTRLTRELGEVAAALNAIRETDVPDFNKLLLENGIGVIDAGKKIP